MPSNILSKRTFLPLSLALLVMGCGGGAANPPSPPDAAAGCAAGEPGCPCFANLTCNPPLVCSSFGVCAYPPATDAADNDSPVTPTGGMGGATTTPGLGGATGFDGSVGGFAGTAGAFDAPVSTSGPDVAGGLAGAVGGAAGAGGLTGAAGTTGAGGIGGGTGTTVRMDAGAAGAPGDAGPDPVLNGACSTVGALNCVGHAQKGMMMCDGSKWVPNGACSGSLLCDTMPGPSQGTCVAPVSNCANQQPGYSYCSGNSKVTCGPDLVTVSGETCPYLCTSGQCTGECVPSSRDCNGKIPLSCATNAMWLSGTACTGDCNKGTCCGTSTPNNCGGTCVDLQTSTANCGACGTVCTTTGGKSCRAGVCQCAAGMTDCSGTCASLTTSNANCGACGTVCPTTGGKSCRAGLCQCPEGMADCNGTCVSLTTSSTNCGACGITCTAGKTCQAGLCACPVGTVDCTGTCANTQTDKANCGACGVSCGTSTCYAGTCGGENLIINGDFSDGSTDWQVTQYDTGVTFGMSGGAYCLSLPSYSEAYLGWGSSLTTSVVIAAGYGYTFSYTVSSTDSLSTFQAKVGHTDGKYTPVYSTSADVPVPTAKTFTHSFTPTSSDSSAGIAFYMYSYSTGATVCFDNVSLVRH